MQQQLAAAGFVLFCSILPLKASDPKFDQLYVFGDSLSDTGNTFSVSGGLGNPTKAIPPYPPYFRGRFSNNKVWVDYLGDRLGLTPTLFTAIQSRTTIPKQGINFAFGGANSGIGNAVVPDAHLPGVLEQVGLFTRRLQANKQKADPKALYAVWGGANDYLFANSTNVNQTVKNVLDSVTLLTQAGAKNILVFNLPDIGKSPFAYPKGISGQLTNISASHNSALASALRQFSSSNPSVNIIRVDINSLFNQVIASPGNFGFKNTTISCVTGNFENIKSVCNHPNDFLFFDAVHPTTGTHRLVADAALSAINANSVPKPSTTLFHTSMGK